MCPSPLGVILVHFLNVPFTTRCHTSTFSVATGLADCHSQESIFALFFVECSAHMLPSPLSTLLNIVPTCFDFLTCRHCGVPVGYRVIGNGYLNHLVWHYVYIIHICITYICMKMHGKHSIKFTFVLFLII